MGRRKREDGPKPRRHKGEGSVFQRTDGRWEAVLTLGWQNGKRVRKHYYGKTEADVVRQLNTGRAELQAGKAITSDKQTVADFLTFWLREQVKQTCRRSTFENYEIQCRRHLIPAIGTKRLVKLTPQDVQALMNQKLGEGLSAGTVVNLHAVLRRALNIAYRWELVSRNVAAMVSPPRAPKNEIQPLTLEQARQFLEYCENDRLGPLYVLTLSLGLREGEALGLRWDDIDFERKQLTINVILKQRKGGFEFTEPKTKRSRRTLSLPQVTIEALHKRRATQLAEKMHAGRAWEEWGLVFCNEIGHPYTRRAVLDAFHKSLRQAKLPQFRFHDLRHTTASFLLAQGVDLRRIMEVLGHSNIAMTADLYTHIMPSMRADVADKMDELLGKNRA